MKIQYENWSSKSSEIEVVDAFKAGLQGGSDGLSEMAKEEAENSHKALGRLCDLLRQKGILSAHEVLDIANVYHTDARFIAD